MSHSNSTHTGFTEAFRTDFHNYGAAAGDFAAFAAWVLIYVAVMGLMLLTCWIVFDKVEERWL